MVDHIEQAAAVFGERMDLTTALQLARAGSATVWDYRVSLGELTLRISFPGRSENLHLVMNGCTRIEASTAWTNVALRIEKGVSDRVTVIDSPAGFLVECGSVRVFRNIDPRFEALQ